jgi:hypothetical protein
MRPYAAFLLFMAAWAAVAVTQPVSNVHVQQVQTDPQQSGDTLLKGTDVSNTGAVTAAGESSLMQQTC